MSVGQRSEREPLLAREDVRAQSAAYVHPAEDAAGVFDDETVHGKRQLGIILHPPISRPPAYFCPLTRRLECDIPYLQPADWHRVRPLVLADTAQILIRFLILSASSRHQALSCARAEVSASAWLCGPLAPCLPPLAPPCTLSSARYAPNPHITMHSPDGRLSQALPRSGGEKVYLEHFFRRPKFFTTCIVCAYFIINVSTPTHPSESKSTS